MSDRLTPRLLDRAKSMARNLRMDSLGNVHVTPVEQTSGSYWRITAELEDGRIIGFYLFADGAIQIFGTIPCHVQARLGAVGQKDPPGDHVLGNGGWIREWADSCAQLDMFTD